MAARGESVILLGSGGHALVVLDILQAMGIAELAGVVTQDEKVREFCGLPLLGREADLPRLHQEGYRRVAIGVGGFTDNAARIRIYRRLKELGFETVSAIHPSTIRGRGVEIGEAAAICGGVTLNPAVRIGVNTIIYTNASVDHETRIGDHVLISAGVTVGAYAAIGDESVLSLGSSIVSGMRVGAGALVAAGAVVVEDVEPGGRVAGVPARPWSGGRG